MTKPSICQKIDELIKDEEMASKEYENYSKDPNFKYKFPYNPISVLNDMSQDEAKHKIMLIKLKEKYCG